MSSLPTGVSITPDGRYYIRYRPGRNTLDPMRTKEYFGRGPVALEQAVARLAQLLDRRKLQKPIGVTFAELANQYMLARVHDMSEVSAENWYYKMRAVIFPFFGRLSASQIGHETLDKYRHQRTLAGVKQTTIRREFGYIFAALNWAVRRKLIASTAIAGYEMPKKDAVRVRPIRDDDLERILAVAPPHLYRAILVAAQTGLRPGAVELFSLTWSAFDEVNGNLSITSAKKGGLEARVVPLLPEFCQQLQEWREQDAGIRWIIHYRGRPVKKSLQKGWRAAKKKAGITEPLRLYSIRHRFITKLIDAGADLKAVSEIVGHRDIAMTIRVYQESSSQRKRDAIQLLNMPQSKKTI
jgi:integrase